MKVERSVIANTERFELGDVISFKLTTGEEVQAFAVQETPEGMLFMTVDCLRDEQPMFKSTEGMRDEDFSYDNSDLRKVLNGAILDSFPAEIKDCMKVVYGDGDLLRIPTEKEIFGENEHGQEEGKVKQFKDMKNRRNRIAWQGSKTGEFGWYWLMNRHREYASYFASVYGNGCAIYGYASGSFGVRLVFLLSQTPTQKSILDKLERCPFCGGDANLFVNDGVRVLCPSCGVSSKVLADALTPRGVSGNAVKSVIEAWNRRTSDKFVR